MEVDLSEARATFETNFIAVICMCKTFLPLLIQAKGTIVQIGSVAGVSTFQCAGFSMGSFTKQIIADLRPIRSFLTYLARFTMRQRLLCTHSATLCVLSWRHLGTFPPPGPELV